MKKRRKVDVGDGSDQPPEAGYSADEVVISGDQEKYIEIIARLGIAMLDIAKCGFRGDEFGRRFADAAKKAVQEIEDAGIEISIEPLNAQWELPEFSDN